MLALSYLGCVGQMHPASADAESMRRTLVCMAKCCCCCWGWNILVLAECLSCCWCDPDRKKELHSGAFIFPNAIKHLHALLPKTYKNAHTPPERLFGANYDLRAAVPLEALKALCYRMSFFFREFSALSLMRGTTIKMKLEPGGG